MGPRPACLGVRVQVPRLCQALGLSMSKMHNGCLMVFWVLLGLWVFCLVACCPPSPTGWPGSRTKPMPSSALLPHTCLPRLPGNFYSFSFNTGGHFAFIELPAFTTGQVIHPSTLMCLPGVPPQLPSFLPLLPPAFSRAHPSHAVERGRRQPGPPALEC